MNQQKYYLRFTLAQRIEHWVLTFSFTILGATGLPQRFVGSPWAESTIAAMGGIEATRIIHRYAAILLMILTIYHGAAVTYKVVVQRVGLSMMPGWPDVRDLLGVISYNLGLSQTRPQLPRYNFEEKLEYWAVIWGTVIMVITGFMLWNPIATAEFLPGFFIPAAKAMHSAEALLAILAIIVWHMYGVHLRKLNKSMFTGRLSAETMAREHALELEQIEGGTLLPRAPAEEEVKRARLFTPIAIIVIVALLFGVYEFVTFEETAISTVPAADYSPDEVFHPLAVTLGGNIHATLKEYTGPESCSVTGCHSPDRTESAMASTHNQRIAAAGPNPWLAELVENETATGQAAPNCLLCHAEDYRPDDLLSSAHTVRVAGGDTCLRCHSNYPESDIHHAMGMACVSCHTSDNHEISSKVACGNCHIKQPHSDPFLNIKHERLDCRTCHVRNDTQLIADVSRPVPNLITGFFEPASETKTGSPTYVWQAIDGTPASRDTEGAQIVPIIPVTLLVPDRFDPTAYARIGSINGSVQETTTNLIANHGVTRENVRTCDTCHGPNGDFDFVSLGYNEEQADNLSVKPAAIE